jgi:hypothetical protein
MKRETAAVRRQSEQHFEDAGYEAARKRIARDDCPERGHARANEQRAWLRGYDRYNAPLAAYSVEAEWGTTDEGTYVEWVWARSEAEAGSACVSEMNHSLWGEIDNSDPRWCDYNVTGVTPLENWIRSQEGAISNARRFISEGPESADMRKPLMGLCAELDGQAVAQVHGKDVTRADLSAAFNRVASKENWKMPIDAVVDIENDYAKELIERAVIFLTGSVPTFEPIAGATLPACRYRVKAAGYYAAIGA